MDIMVIELGSRGKTHVAWASAQETPTHNLSCLSAGLFLAEQLFLCRFQLFPLISVYLRILQLERFERIHDDG